MNLVQYGPTTYKYDANKISKKTTNNITTTYITIEDRIIEEKNSKYQIKYYYGINGILSFKYNEKEYKYIKDITNNIVGIVDEEGTIVARYIYDGWGNHLVIDKEGKENKEETFIGNINPIRYKGYYYDKETGLYYCNSRYYSPELCRWISPDSIEYLDPESINGLNLYTYCGNAPIMNIDPSGYAWYNVVWDWINTIAGFLKPVSTLTAIGSIAVATIDGRWSDVVDDWKNGRMNPFNQDANIATNAKVLSFYKGSTVVKQNII